MPHRKLRPIKKKGELPSLLLNNASVPEDLYFAPISNKSTQHLGPLFFGTCKQFYRTLHKLELGNVQHDSHSHPINETIDHLFLPKPDEEPRKKPAKVIHPHIKRKKFYPDPYTHKCPGARKVFKPEVKPRVIDFGKTTSVIEGETSVEIAICRRNRFSFEYSETELISPSDLREETLKDLPYKKRIAHPHFPKLFATVSVIGPTIPAAIIITKLPSKRKTSSEMNLLLKPHVEEKPEPADEYEENTEEEFSEAEFEVDQSVEEEMEDTTEPSRMEEDLENGKETDVVLIEEDNDLEEPSVGGISAEPDEAMETVQELKEEETIGVDVTENDVDENPEEKQNEEEEEENREED